MSYRAPEIPSEGLDCEADMIRALERGSHPPERLTGACLSARLCVPLPNALRRQAKGREEEEEGEEARCEVR